METILVKETDLATLEVLTVALQMKGYRVFSLPDEYENVLEIIRRQHARLVLLDCRLGRDADKPITHWIKAHYPSLPLIAVSCDNNIGEEYHQLGFDGYLKKPFDLSLLYHTVRNFLHGRANEKVNEVALPDN